MLLIMNGYLIICTDYFVQFLVGAKIRFVIFLYEANFVTFSNIIYWRKPRLLPAIIK